MDKIIVLIGCILLIGLIVWWFFGKRENKSASAHIEGDTQTVEVVVNGGYSPSVITLQKNIPAEIVFTRKDPSSCLEEVILPDFGIREKLPLNKPYVIKVNPDKSGEYTYSCGMNMFFGKVEVK